MPNDLFSASLTVGKVKYRNQFGRLNQSWAAAELEVSREFLNRVIHGKGTSAPLLRKLQEFKRRHRL